VLGEGQFGSVSKGIWREETGYILEVAIKSLKPNSEERDKVKFLQEAATMAQFRHPNVVTLYGVVSSRGTVSLYDSWQICLQFYSQFPKLGNDCG
jgi:serine/threonine protein kinase